MAELSRPASAGADDDQALLDRLRAGDDSAFGLLFSRHADAVRRFAMQQVRDAAEADDLTAEAFFRVLQAVRRGNGPTDHVRTYLLTVARRVSWEWSARRRDVPVEDAELDRRAEPYYTDNSSRLAESTLISQAFSSLPERWRTVLWQVEVEGERPAVVAPHFGLSANATAALARRARDGLRAAYLQAHLTEGLGATACRSVREKLGGYTAGTVKGLEGRRIRAHLRGCDQCKSLQGELHEVCSALRAHAGVLVPMVSLGATAAVAGHVAGSGFGAALVGKGALLATRVKLALTATSVAAVGVFGIAIGPWLSHAQPDAAPDHSDHQIVSTYCAPSPGQPTAGTGPSGSIPTSAFASGHAVSAKVQAAEGAQSAFFGNHPGRQVTPPSQTGSATPPSGDPQTAVTVTSTSPTSPTGKILDAPTSGTSETSDTSATAAVLAPTTTTTPTKSTPATTSAPRKTPTTSTVTPTPSDPTPTSTSTSTSTAASSTSPRKPQ